MVGSGGDMMTSPQCVDVLTGGILFFRAMRLGLEGEG
jgi:hypothetical protein